MLPMTRAEAEDFLYREAQLLDDRLFDDWSRLFAKESLYWIPIDETRSRDQSVSIVYDPPLRREERVHHLMRTRFPSQSPPSRTVHVISNVTVAPGPQPGEVLLRSNQVVYETRVGDFRQTGLGELRTIVTRMEHLLRPEEGGFRIALKKILLIDRDLSVGNLGFII